VVGRSVQDSHRQCGGECPDGRASARHTLSLPQVNLLSTPIRDAYFIEIVISPYAVGETRQRSFGPDGRVLWIAKGLNCGYEFAEAWCTGDIPGA